MELALQKATKLLLKRVWRRTVQNSMQQKREKEKQQNLRNIASFDASSDTKSTKSQQSRYVVHLNPLKQQILMQKQEPSNTQDINNQIHQKPQINAVQAPAKQYSFMSFVKKFISKIIQTQQVKHEKTMLKIKDEQQQALSSFNNHHNNIKLKKK